MKKFLAVLLMLAMLLCGAAFAEDTAPALTKDVVVLFTSDVHCGIDQGWGYAGVANMRNSLQADNHVVLVDDGDAIQGETIGTLTKGSAIIELMNAVGYDIAIPGNHEFDYGMENFLELTKQANFPYISANFTCRDKLVFAPYVIKEFDGVKIAFVGMTTPNTITSSTPVYFQDDEGNFIYGFMQDETGDKLYAAVQSAVDAARAEGATYVVAMGHMGIEESCSPYMSTEVITHTTGIDAFLDGHAHETMACNEVKNAEGKTVLRAACGTKLSSVGYLRIAKDGKLTTGLYTWTVDIAAPKLLNLTGDAADAVAAQVAKLDEIRQTVVATSQVPLYVNDPVAVTAEGTPVRIVRNAETNLGDLCADAYRALSNADIAFVNGGGIRKPIKAGDITLDNILSVFPWGNLPCKMEVTGQTVLDMLEMGAINYPEESGGFLSVSGLKYTIMAGVPSSIELTDKGEFSKVAGKYRVTNVQVLNKKTNEYEPLDLNKTYTLGGIDYTILYCGDGFTMFNDSKVLKAGDASYTDAQMIVDYIENKLGGTIGEEYAKPQGRISVNTDIKGSDWFYEAADYVLSNGLMTGTSDTTFTPNGALTRGMLVTVLYRMAGSPKVEGKVSEKFSDCTDGSWYADAVLWASANKVVDGYEDGTFKPTKSITRQEMAKVLYGYDKIGGKTAEDITEKLTYTDLDAIADWALEAVTYCTAEKYLAGSNGAFSPKGTATRAMGAKVLMNMTKEAA